MSIKGMNKVFLVGFLGVVPELRTSKGGAFYTRLSIATHRSIRKTDGQWEDRTEWHRVTVWGQKAEYCSHRLQKGALLAIEGYLAPYVAESNLNSAQKYISIIAEDVQFLSHSAQKISDADGPSFEATS